MQKYKKCVDAYALGEGRGEEVRMTTIEVLEMVQGIIPSKPIDEHDIFDVLKQTGFNYGINEENGIYVWFLWKKEVDL